MSILTNRKAGLSSNGIAENNSKLKRMNTELPYHFKSRLAAKEHFQKPGIEIIMFWSLLETERFSNFS
jgi:hypothetical protein